MCGVAFGRWFARQVQEDVRGLHIELIRELEAQRHEMRALLTDRSGWAEEVAALRRDNAALRAENEQLRMLRGHAALAKGTGP